MKTALISVYNKQGIVEFAKDLVDIGYKILASGGTAKVLAEAGIKVTDTAALVGGAILGHRVVTLSREIHAGLLSRDNNEDNQELKKLNIPRIDLVCVDLYPLREEIVKWNQLALSRPSGALSPEEKEKMAEAIIEKTDIGGPTMLRSAAKGRRVVVCDPVDRLKVVEWLRNGEQEKEKFINDLCAKAEFIVADYVLASARYHSGGKYDGFLGEQISECKYGENGWQVPAGVYADSNINDELSPKQFTTVAGISPSYNNSADVDRLLQTMTHIAAAFNANPSPTLPLGGEGGSAVPKIAVGVKHGNPCGAAISEDPAEAIKKMLEGDLRAIFGGLVMLNFEVDEILAEILLSHKIESGRRLLDGIIAASFTQAAIDMMKRKGDKCRFIVNNNLSKLNKNSLDTHSRFRYVRGGFLKQPNYNFILDLSVADVVASFMGPSQPNKSGNYNLSEAQKADVLLAWAVGSTSNSNTVTLVKDGMLIGNGVGQQDRVSCCQLAIKRATDAKHEINGATAYSDSFFPFTDGPQTLIDAGVKTIFATSGSVRDEEVKKLCLEKEVTLIMLPDKEARGFFGH
jgi:phosphoribosylaminoimidazolecarboxamide formyltransferase/IMP cyclohydrolase